jgi:hypothetical protein
MPPETPDFTEVKCPICGSGESFLPRHIGNEHPDADGDVLDELLDRARGDDARP